MNNFERLLDKKQVVNEESYEELQKMGSKKLVVKSDGKKVHQFGKNYMLGYYENKLKDAEKKGDKFEMKIYKDALEGVKRRLSKFKTEFEDNS